MSSRFQSALLSHQLCYPNALAWSDENLLAVACCGVVLILNPAKPHQSRGVVTVPSSKPFPVGVIDGGGDALLSACLLPCNLSRDTRAYVRSISWSPVGLANNAGCLLAVCTTAGRVKLYRFPYFEFSNEWIEVVDISEIQFTYFASINFEESQIMCSQRLDVIPNQDASHESANDPFTSSLIKEGKRRKKNAPKIAAGEADNLREHNKWQNVPVPVGRGNPGEKVVDDCNLPVINAQQYASRSAMLTSLVVAWSPILGTSGDGLALPHNSSHHCAVLAVGGKCGRISLWRIHAPKCYSIVSPNYAGKVLLLGHLKAHDSWITAIAWAECNSDASKPNLLLASASSNGRVMIWQMNDDELLNSSELVPLSYSLLKEIMTVDSAAVSAVSLAVPSDSPWKLLVAVGKGSGSFEVGFLDVRTSTYENIGCYNAHTLIVTGLAWTFDGRCLYSCSQDNSVKSWILVGNSLREVTIPTNTPDPESYQDVPHVSDSCFGLAVSSGNLALAVARKFDADLLNPMYEGRIHKAACEFLWIGGQQLDIDISFLGFPEINTEVVPGFPAEELMCWESNILWSLNQYENLDRLLNLWDIIRALLAFKHSTPNFVERILLKWLACCFGCQFSISSTFLFEASKILHKLSSRQLHLINLISRHVILAESKEENMYNMPHEAGIEEEKAEFWKKLMLSSEKELRERLVGICFSAILSLSSNSSVDLSRVSCWNTDGLLQMQQWISLNETNVNDQSRFLATEVQKLDRRKLKDIVGSEVDEKCHSCLTSVPFESAEYAICSGEKRCRRKRCAVSMRVSSARYPWCCMSCQREISQLTPRVLFTMPGYPSDFRSFLEFSTHKEYSTPCCPFCGILLGRSQPKYWLSPSPV